MYRVKLLLCFIDFFHWHASLHLLNDTLHCSGKMQPVVANACPLFAFSWQFWLQQQVLAILHLASVRRQLYRSGIERSTFGTREKRHVRFVENQPIVKKHLWPKTSFLQVQHRYLSLFMLFSLKNFRGNWKVAFFFRLKGWTPPQVSSILLNFQFTAATTVVSGTCARIHTHV